MGVQRDVHLCAVTCCDVDCDDLQRLWRCVKVLAAMYRKVSFCVLRCQLRRAAALAAMCTMRQRQCAMSGAMSYCVATTEEMFAVMWWCVQCGVDELCWSECVRPLPALDVWAALSSN